jgi:phosphopantetheinyl transferase
VVHDQLGRPQLLLGEYEGPAISFSESGGNVWAALCGDESDIGIDVAGTDEFHGEYPFHRVFHPQELHHALGLADGDLEKASALLWSIKESVVKALGCAFHLVDPRQITVYPSAGGAADGDDGYTFSVDLAGKSLVRFPLAASKSLWVRSIPQVNMWLSIALLNWQHQCGDE